MKQKFLWVGDLPAPPNVREAAGTRWQPTAYERSKPLSEQLRETPVAVVCANGASGDPVRLGKLLDELDRTPAVAIFLLPLSARAAWTALSRRKGQFLCCREDATPVDLAAKLAAAESLQPAIENLQTELASARVHQQYHGPGYEELDEEMRLAARLQRDFLPRRLPEVGPSRFGVLYRPATWVSGDIYDVVRLDETHVGFYVADAVGHGLPAALLTMFIKKALQMKRIVGHTYQIVPPHVTMAELNNDICEQNLSGCQFCTVVYCVLDTARLVLTYARAGHPEPVLLHEDGLIDRLDVPGSLLGIFPEEEFAARQVQLASGDRLVLYTDGAEPALCNGFGGPSAKIEDTLSHWTGLSREEMLLELTGRVDNTHPGPREEDDVTVLVMDVEQTLRIVKDE